MHAQVTSPVLVVGAMVIVVVLNLLVKVPEEHETPAVASAATDVMSSQRAAPVLPSLKFVAIFTFCPAALPTAFAISALAPLRLDAGRFSLASRFDLPKIGGYIVPRASDPAVTGRACLGRERVVEQSVPSGVNLRNRNPCDFQVALPK